MNFEPNPKLYREMSKPFSSMQEANAALQAFMDELGELRKKHKLPDVYFCVRISYEKDGEELPAMTHGGYGDSLEHESMLAFAIGQVQSDRQEMISDLMKRGMRAALRRG